MDKLYKKIVDEFADNTQLFIDKELTPPRYIDLFRGQTTNPEDFEIVPYSIFVGYSIDWLLEIVTVTIHVLIDMMQPTNSLQTNVSSGLRTIQYYKTVHEILNGLTSDNTGALERISEAPQPIRGGNYQIITYQCKIYQHQYDNVNTDGTVEKYTMSGYLLQKKR